jgi:hypothetical protein
MRGERENPARIDAEVEENQQMGGCATVARRDIEE